MLPQDPIVTRIVSTTITILFQNGSDPFETLSCASKR
jgi:hypothetical protein